MDLRGIYFYFRFLYLLYLQGATSCRFAVTGLNDSVETRRDPARLLVFVVLRKKNTLKGG